MEQPTFTLQYRHENGPIQTVQLTNELVDVGGGLVAKLRTGFKGVQYAEIRWSDDVVKTRKKHDPMISHYVLRVDVSLQNTFTSFFSTSSGFKLLGPKTA